MTVSKEIQIKNMLPPPFCTQLEPLLSDPKNPNKCECVADVWLFCVQLSRDRSPVVKLGQAYSQKVLQVNHAPLCKIHIFSLWVILETPFWSRSHRMIQVNHVTPETLINLLFDVSNVE